MLDDAHNQPIALALGTAQFGIPYGINGRGETVPEDEVREMLEYASKAGIRILDTAPSYGGIEVRLCRLIGDLDFEVISKISALPADADKDGAMRFVEESIERSMSRLGSRLKTILFHNAQDLAGRFGDAIWRSAAALCRDQVRLGASCYAPAELIELKQRYPISVGQLPGNAFDQRLAKCPIDAGLADVEIHLRSVFLQGLLLMPLEQAARRVSAAAKPMAAWTNWCAFQGFRPTCAALGIARALPGVHVILLGVDRLSQLEEILQAWDDTMPCYAPGLACDSPEVIDPRQWAAL